MIAGRFCLILGLAFSVLWAAEPAITVTSDQPGNVFLGREGMVSVSVAEAGRATLLNENDAVLEEVAVVPGTPAILALPQPGYYRVRAKVGPTTVERGAMVLGREGPLEARGAAGFFAVNTANPLAERAGGRWNRAFLDLTSVRIKGDGFAWGRRCVAPVESEWLVADGLELPTDQEWIICLSRLPDSLSTMPNPIPEGEKWKFYPPRDWEQFAALVRWAVAGLPPTIRHIEVSNEPDANWRGTEEELVRYHAVVAEAVHAVRPGAHVLGPCPCNVKIDWLARLDALGLFAHLDGLSFHPYVNGTAPEGEFIERIDALRAWNAARSHPLPLYITEFGWQTDPSDWQLAVDERTHARYTARSQLLLATRPDIIAYQVFCLLNRHRGNWGAYSLLAADGSPRLAYAYAATAMHRLAGATRARVFELGAGARTLVWASEGGTRLALWSDQDDVPVRLPAAAGTAWNASGRQLTPPSEESLATTDPLYLAMEGLDLADAPELPPMTVLAGATPPLPFATVLATDAVIEADASGGWRVRADAPRGRWQVAGRGPHGWAVVPLTIVAPVQVAGELEWEGGQPGWRVTLSSRIDRPATVTLTLTIAEDSSPRLASVELAPGGSATVRLPLDRLPWGKRLDGSLEIEVGGEAPSWSDRLEFDTTIAAVSAAPAPDAPDWERLPIMDFSDWAPFRAKNELTKRRLPRAHVRLAHGPEGLHLSVEVDDSVHRQDLAPADMWRQDSLQVGIDVDTDEAWQPNSGRFWNGHRTAEYGLSLGPEGPRCWRWLAANGLPAHCAEPRVALHIERIGSTTRYRALFPWAVLGLDAPLSPGRSLGLALVVNDVGDLSEDWRNGLRLFDGIVTAKDPTRFGRLTLLPREASPD